MKFSVYLLAVIAVLVGLFVLLKPDASAPPTDNKATAAAAPAPAVPATAPTPSAPGTANAPTPVTTAASTPPPSATPPPEPRVFALDVRKGRLVSGPTVIQVKKGDEVVLRLTTDIADEMHLHGYDLNLKTRAGETSTLRFSATRTGRFGYELHHSKAELGALEVYPR